MSSCKRSRPGYLADMRLPAARSASTFLVCALAASLAAAAVGLALAGWMRHGAGIFLAMAETGLSWCF